MKKNCQHVVEAWDTDRAAGGPGDAIWTDGERIYSYQTVLVEYPDGRPLLLNRTRYSPTTSSHQNALAAHFANWDVREVTGVPINTRAGLEVFLPEAPRKRWKVYSTAIDVRGIRDTMEVPASPVRCEIVDDPFLFGGAESVWEVADTVETFWNRLNDTDIFRPFATHDATAVVKVLWVEELPDHA